MALFVGFFVVAAVDTHWLIRRTRGDAELAWANNFGRMSQVAVVGFAVGGSFANLPMFDGFYAVLIMIAAARRIVAAELAARNRRVDLPLAGALPTAAASQAGLCRPLVGT